MPALIDRRGAQFASGHFRRCRPRRTHVGYLDLYTADMSPPRLVGEPPLMLAISVLGVIADAIHSLAPGFPVPLNAPATPESILHAIGSVAHH
jgi:xanthine dehydrogenase molybdopterin-binding subunit B